MGRLFLYQILVFLLCMPTFAAAAELDVPFHKQNTTVWCWAATIAMVGEYLTGNPAEDCDVLSAYDYALGGPGDCCINPQRCARTGQSQEIANILGNIYNITGYHHKRALSFDEIVDEIDNNQPFIIALNTGFSGHVVVVSGYQYPNNVILLDPLSGRHVVPYHDIIQNFQLGRWTETFTVYNENNGGAYNDESDSGPECRIEYEERYYTEYESQYVQANVPCAHCGYNMYGYWGCDHAFDIYTDIVDVPVERVELIPVEICN